MIYLKSLLITLLVISTFEISTAQDSKPLVFVGIAANSYKGDIDLSYGHFSSSFSAGIKFNRKKNLNGQLTLSIGKVNGETMDDNAFVITDPSVKPSKIFKTNFLSFNYDLQYNFLKRDNYIIYFSQGLGIFHFKPKNAENSNLADIPESRNPEESYGAISLELPTQVGGILLFKNGFGVGVSGGFLNILSDYLDNVSEVGTKDGNDNILIYKFNFYYSLK